jgi:hypothetical protein
MLILLQGRADQYQAKFSLCPVISLDKPKNHTGLCEKEENFPSAHSELSEDLKILYCG